MLSIIVTVDLSRRPVDLLRKLQTLLSNVDPRIEVVLGHNDFGSAQDRLLKLLVADRCRLVQVRGEPRQPVCNSRLRNIAVERASNALIALFDADLFANPELLLAQATAVRGGEPFVMLPCFYLTKLASRKLNRDTEAHILAKCLQADRRYVLHLASPSSAIVLTRHDYITLGGFDERYIGYGYEDFDFMLRLALHHGLVQVNDGLSVDETYLAPLFAQGFRKQLSVFSLHKLLQHLAVFHLYHPQQKHRDDYYLARAANRDRFSSLLEQTIERLPEGNNPAGQCSLLNYFLSVCSTPEQFPILFDCRQSHRERVDSWRRRLKYTLGF